MFVSVLELFYLVGFTFSIAVSYNDEVEVNDADHAYCSEYCHSYIFVVPWGGLKYYGEMRRYSVVLCRVGVAVIWLIFTTPSIEVNAVLFGKISLCL